MTKQNENSCVPTTLDAEKRCDRHLIADSTKIKICRRKKHDFDQKELNGLLCVRIFSLCIFQNILLCE